MSIGANDGDAESVLRDVPDEARRRLKLYADLLVRWQATINLVAPATLPLLWARHIGDSMQVQAAVPNARRWIDLGSGGGFPGLVTAILLAEQSGAQVRLVESDKRKAAFLRTVARETGVPAIIHAERIEAVVPDLDEIVDAVSARALGPLPKLLHLSQRLLENGAVGVFPKGQSVEAELTGLTDDRRFRFESVPSRTRDGSSILVVRLNSTLAEASERAASGD